MCSSLVVIAAEWVCAAVHKVRNVCSHALYQIYCACWWGCLLVYRYTCDPDGIILKNGSPLWALHHYMCKSHVLHILNTLWEQADSE